MAADTKSMLTILDKECELGAESPVQITQPEREPRFLVSLEPRSRGWREALAILARRIPSNEPGNEREPRFLVSLEQRGRGLLEALAVVMRKIPANERGNARTFLTSDLMRFSPPGRAFFTSAMMHFSVAFFLIRVPLLLLFSGPTPRASRAANAPLVYRLQMVNLARYLPSPQPPGPGGAPGRGPRADRQPARGSDAFHPKMTIVSNPARPNNKRQTISQNSSPPELKMQAEPRLPNIVISSPIMLPQMPMANVLSAPVPASVRDELKRLEIPTLPYASADLPFPLVPAENFKPSLPVVPASQPGPAQPAGQNQIAGLGGTDKIQGDAPGLMVVGVDPAAVKNLLAVLPGNRSGAFPISPSAGQPGSPGGVPAKEPGGGAGDPGPGGDPSTGVGPGKLGGGGGGNGNGSALGGSLGIAGSGRSGSGSSGGAFVYSDPSSLVLPLATAPVVPVNPLIVSAGPLGGGGLDVYGVLPCHKIYTVYLPMPGKNWTLQYCAAASVPSDPPRAQGASLRLDEALAPPQPTIRFDFLRLPLPKDILNKIIVLRGAIDASGAVTDLRVQRSVWQPADQAALAAFSRWQFRPAQRARKGLAVDFLIGIPAVVGVSLNPAP